MSSETFRSTRSESPRGLTLRMGLDALGGLGLVCLSAVILTIYEISHRFGYSYPTGPANSIYAISPFDEGVYTETGALIAHGYQLYGQIYSAQPPVLPVVLSLVDRAASAGLVEARWTILFFGLVAVIGAAVIAGISRGWFAAGLATILLVLSPEFLVYSHAIEEEIPMTALCLVSLALAIAWSRRREFELAAASGFFFGLAVLTKFLAFGLLAPLAVLIAIALWDAGRDRLPILRDALLFVIAGALPLALSLLVWGQAEWNQMINDRLGASADQAAIQQGSSFHLLRIFLETDPGMALIAAFAAVALLARDWKTGLVLDSWLVATLVLLLTYHPLFAHHVAVLLGPMAVVGGAGLSSLIPAKSSSFRERAKWVTPASIGESRSSGRTRKRSLPALAAFLATAGALVYILLLPVQVSAYSRLLVAMTPSDHQLIATTRLVVQNSPATGLIAASDPIICVLAHRLCVPQMVDTSYVRVRTGKLSRAIDYTRRSSAAVVVLSRGLCQAPYMTRYVRWVHGHYRLQAPMAIDSPAYCPFVGTASGTKPTTPHWAAGIYVLAGRGFLH